MEINSKQVQSLGLSKSELEKLDKMDGKADGKISESIFKSAQATVNSNSQTYTASADAAPKDDKSFFQKVKDFVFGEEAPKPVENTNAAEAPAQTTEATEADKAAEQEVRTKMQPFLDKAAQHFERAGSLKGFSFSGFPKGIYHVDFGGRFGYEDESNDTYKIGNDGKGFVDRKADSYTLVLTVEYATPDGKSKTITLEKQLSKIPSKESDSSGEWDIYKDEA